MVKITINEIEKIANVAKDTLNVPTELEIIPKPKAFKLVTRGFGDNAGSYSYARDKVFINKEVAQLLDYPHLEWMLFHEFGHARIARSFAELHFFPAISYSDDIDDKLISNGIKICWNSLCDCFVNELLLQKKNLKKFDSTLEKTIDTFGERLATGLCFQLYDYWKHGINEELAKKAEEKIPVEIFNQLKKLLPLTLLENIVKEAIDSLNFVVGTIFYLRVSTHILTKKQLETETFGSEIPKLWGDDNTELALIRITR